MSKPVTPACGLNKKQVKIVSQELDQILAKRQCIKPAFVVDEARPAGSPLHPFFTWNNSRAGELWREEQARHLIRSVRIIHPLTPDIAVRKYVNVFARDDEDRFDGNAYLHAREVAETPDYKKQTLDYALEEIRAWRTKYAGFKEFFSIYAEIESAERNINATRKAKRIAA